MAAGAVAASGGELYVSTRGKHYKIHWQNDGMALPESLGPYHEEGTKISFTLGKLPINSNWARLAMNYAKERCGGIQTPLAETVSAELGKEPVHQWKDVVVAVSEEMIKNCRF